MDVTETHELATPDLAQQLLGAPAAIARVDDRGWLRITGPDATRWLNGMVTNSIQALEPGQGSYNFLLNAQGRIQGDCTIYREPGAGDAAYLLVTDASQLETIRTTLDRFIIMDDVTLEPVFADRATWLLVAQGEAANAAALSALSLPAVAPLHLAQASAPQGEVLLAALANTTLPHTLLVAAEAALAGSLASETLPTLAAETLEKLRIVEGTPRYGIDIRDKELPQETSQTQALHFNKGCYLGQEIVERIRSRGQVHRLLLQFRLTGELPATLPAPLQVEGKVVGELTSATSIGNTLLALGYLRREHLIQTSAILYEGGMAHPIEPRNA